ncbi:tetratricopeptide repeat protein [Clostridiales bacterium oral taxon 876 str. F0540]|nr:tetratricopeptide repeat protein [Clostridiales bacterium oral taxon 876 str. F0540]
MIFLTTGEKIRSLRKKFNMRQQELEDENITRAFISMIETGKRGLSRETAKVIAAKLNSKAESLNIPLKIDEDYLLRTPEQDAELYCFEKLNNIPTQDEMEVIINIATKYRLTKAEAQAYKVLGDYEFESNSYTSAFINYMLSLDLFKDTDEKNCLGYLYNRLGECKKNNKEFLEAISFFDRAIYYSTLYKNIDIEKYSIYSIAEAHKCLGEFDKALSFIDTYLTICEKEVDFDQYIYGNVLKANCYILKGNVDKACALYEDLLNLCINKDEALLYVTYNYAIVSKEYKDINSLEYFNKAQEIAERSDKSILTNIYIEKARIYANKHQYNEALILAKSGLKLAQEYNNVDALVNSYYIIIDTYTFLKDFQNLKTVYTKLLDILRSNKHYKEELNRVYNKLALLYLEQNDIEMCKKYLNMAS